MKKGTIGSNPLEAYLGTRTQKKQQKEQEIADQERHLKQRITIHLTVELIERIKNAVYWEPGLTLTAFAESALNSALNRLEKERGEKYPERGSVQLKGGRPLI